MHCEGTKPHAGGRGAQSQEVTSQHDLELHQSHDSIWIHF